MPHGRCSPLRRAPVRFSPLPKRGVLLGLSGPQLAVVGTGAAVLVAALYLDGGATLAYASPIIAACAALAWVSVGGRRLIA